MLINKNAIIIPETVLLSNFLSPNLYWLNKQIRLVNESSMPSALAYTIMSEKNGLCGGDIPLNEKGKWRFSWLMLNAPKPLFR
jgi:hypothetical protein